MGILAGRSGKGVFKSHGIYFVFYLPYALHFRRLVVGAADVGLSHSEGKRVCIRVSRENAQSPNCAQPAVRFGWESRAMYHDCAHSAAGSIAAEGAGAWISGADCRSTTTRGKASARQQVERYNNRTYSMTAAAAAAAAGRSWRGQTWVNASWSFLCFGNIAGRRVTSSLSGGYS